MEGAFNLGRHEAQIGQLLVEMQAANARLTTIEAILNERRGERRIAVWAVGTISGIVGAVISLAVKLAPMFTKHS